jgi:hypothetical protein
MFICHLREGKSGMLDEWRKKGTGIFPEKYGGKK